MQLVIVNSIQPPQRDRGQEKKVVPTSNGYGMEHSKIKKRVRQNDGSKIPKTKRTTKPTTHQLTLLPFPQKKKKKKSKKKIAPVSRDLQQGGNHC